MAPSRTKQSRKARRIRRQYLLLCMALADYTPGTPEYTKQEEKIARADAALATLDLIGWETRAEGYTGDADEDSDEGEDEAPTLRKVKKAKKTAKGKKAQQVAEAVAA